MTNPEDSGETDGLNGDGDVAEQLEVHPLDVIVEGFDQLEEQLNIFKESVTEKFELFTVH
jgi:hypothetical protein